MSTRRTTRATSKAASSRGVSPAITEISIPATPARRSSRRAGSATPLPSVPNKPSAAYGDNTTVQPAALKVPAAGQEISSALNNILEPQSNGLPVVNEEETSGTSGNARGGRTSSSFGRRSRVGAPQQFVDDRSYGNESSIFGAVGFESSLVSQSELGGIPEPLPAPARPVGLNRRKVPAAKARREEIDREEREEILRALARAPVTCGREQAEASTESFAHLKDRYVEKCLAIVANMVMCIRWFWNWVKAHSGKIALGLGALFFCIVLLSSGSYRWYGLELTHNIGQFVPTFVAHPLSTFSPREIKDLQTRITIAEREIAYLKKRNDLDSKALSRLEELLPEYIVVKKTKDGGLEISQEFWHALESRMRSENAYLREATGKPSNNSSTSDISLAQVENLMEKSKLWDRFLHNNRAQLKEWAAQDFDARFPGMLKQSLNKEEFILLLRQNWEDAQKEVRAVISKLSNRLDDVVHDVAKSQVGAVGYTREDIKAISKDVFRSLFSAAQLEALSKANMNINIAANQHRLNHFSPGTGASVNPKLTSPNYLFPSMDRNILIKGLLRAVWHKIPTPNPPEVALRRWEEHGDCWCSPAKNVDGFGPSLAVIMANEIYPDQIIIEHIPASGSLEPGAAPKDMELLAYIEDRDTYHTIKQRSNDIFQDEALQDQQQPQPYGFVRIATWTYDLDAISNIQSFPLQIDLSTYNDQARTNRLIVRSKNNWGNVNYTCLYRVRVNGEIARTSSSA